MYICIVERVRVRKRGRDIVNGFAVMEDKIGFYPKLSLNPASTFFQAPNWIIPSIPTCSRKFYTKFTRREDRIS